MGQPLHPERRDADPAGRGHGASSADGRRRREARRRQGCGRRQGRRRRAKPAARVSPTRRSWAARISASRWTPKAPLKDPKEYTIVGQSIPRIDIPDKVTGRFTYMQDFRRKGMLHARVVPSAGDEGDVDEVERLRLPQDRRLRRRREEREFHCGAGTNRMGGDRGERCDQTTWSDWAGSPDQAKLSEYVRGTKVVKDEDFQKVGDADEALKTPNAKLVKASYDFAIHTHGSIGPSCAIAEYVDGMLDVLDRVAADDLAQADRDDARHEARRRALHLHRRLRLLRPQWAQDAAADAALIAKETGLPVRVQWMRQDEHGWDPKGPPTLFDYRAALRCARQRRRLAVGSLPPGSSEGLRGRAAAGGARGAADRCVAPGQYLPVARNPVHVPEYPRDGALARRDAVPSVVDPHAGPDAEHVRQRELYRRDRRSRPAPIRSSSA